MHIHFDSPSLVVPPSWHTMFARFEMPPSLDQEQQFMKFFLDQTSRLIDKHLQKMREAMRKAREEL